MRLAAVAIVSSTLSTLLAAFSGKLFGQNASYLLFVVAVVIAGLFLAGTRIALWRLDAGFVLVLILFEPIGPVLLHRETPPPMLIFTLLLGFAVACLFGHEGVHGGSER